MGLGLSRNQRKRQLAEAEYGRETVIQLVSDTTGKGADRFHPCCLAPPGLDVLMMGHIDDRPECADRLRGTIAVKRSQRTKTNVPHGAVWSDETELDLIPAIACRNIGSLDRRDTVPIIGMNEFEIALP